MTSGTGTLRVTRLFLVLVAPLLALLGVFVSRMPDITRLWAWSDFEAAGIGLLAINLGLALAMVLLRPTRRLDVFEPRFFIAFLFFMVFVARPLQILFHAEAKIPVLRGDPALIQRALAFGALGIVFFYVGYVSGAGQRLARSLPCFGWPWRRRRVISVVALFWVVGLAGYLAAVIRSGGVAVFLDTLQGRRLFEESATWIFASTLVLTQSATVLLGTFFFKTRRLGFLFLSSLVLSGTLSLLLGGRSTVMLYAVSLVVCYCSLRQLGIRRPLGTAALAAALLAVSVLFVVALGSLRADLQAPDAAARAAAVGMGGIGDRFVGEFNQFDWLAVVIGLVPDRLAFQNGATFGQLLAQFVPRAVWPSKPDPIDYSVTMLVQGIRSGSPFTIIGELYLNFGVPGIVAGMFVFGALCRALYSYVSRRRDDPGVVLIYSYTYASLLHFFTRSFAPMVFGYLLFAVPTFFALRVVEPGRRRAGGRAAVGRPTERWTAVPRDVPR